MAKIKLTKKEEEQKKYFHQLLQSEELKNYLEDNGELKEKLFDKVRVSFEMTQAGAFLLGLFINQTIQGGKQKQAMEILKMNDDVKREFIKVGQQIVDQSWLYLFGTEGPALHIRNKKLK